MLPFEVARAQVLALAQTLTAESVLVEDAVGRVLAQSVVARRTLPPFDNSAMDGYALRAQDAAGPLRVVEKIFAGQTPRVALGPNDCARIMTGARVPEGADTVVMQERVDGDEREVRVTEPVSLGANIRRAGEDVQAGALLLPAGRVLSLPDAAALWAQAVREVSVIRRPSVALLSSGDELVSVSEAGQTLDRLVDTNLPMLSLAARRAGAVTHSLGLSTDSLDDLTERFTRGLDAGVDVLVAVSGASVGERDFTQEALRRTGVEFVFWKVAMKPGKPVLVGRKGPTVVFGLPGNPVSALVTFELFVRPLLRKLQGLPDDAVAGRGFLGGDRPLFNPGGLRLFVRAVAHTHPDGSVWVTPLSSQSSGALASAVGATHLISLAPDVVRVEPRQEVSLISLSWGG